MADRATERQLRMLRHALGLDQAKESYRNHYCANPGDTDCARLVAYGLMEHVRTGVPTGGLETFRVTELGRAVVRVHTAAVRDKHRSFTELRGTIDSRACSALAALDVLAIYDDRLTSTRVWRLK